jgi:hypothetical protein
VDVLLPRKEPGILHLFGAMLQQLVLAQES